MAKKYIVAVWDEDFSGLVAFKTRTRAKRYMSGYSDGCNAYAGSGHSELLNGGKLEYGREEVQQELKRLGWPTLEELEAQNDG